MTWLTLCAPSCGYRAKGQACCGFAVCVQAAWSENFMCLSCILDVLITHRILSTCLVPNTQYICCLQHPAGVRACAVSCVIRCQFGDTCL